jgi:FtsP/CotA-like multicopper oxidase with cupredoxin domain
MIANKQFPLNTRSHQQRAVILSRAVHVALLLLMVASPAALAQTGPSFTEPPRLCPVKKSDANVLDVTLQVQSVPYTRADGTKMQIRAYSLTPGDGWQYCDGQKRPIVNPQIPGPTFQLRKSTEGKMDGDVFKMTLVNKLPVDASGHANHACNPIRDFSQSATIQPGQTCDATSFPSLPTQMPACFHGDNVTNFHYHGFHVSPQFHQDFVLLNLYPEGSQGVSKDDYNAVGSYAYALDPLPYSQAEGTHWYHPHKHGSTALQVLNGMAGTFIITGPFDDWLKSQFPGGLTDRVMVIQQIAQEVNFFNATPPVGFTSTPSDPNIPVDPANPAQCPASATGGCTCQVTSNTPAFSAPTLVNGQINPTVTMRSGEIQRWRFVNSMVQIGGLLQIGFEPGFEVKQIAQDGVQFSPENYTAQPLISMAWFVPGQAPQVLTNANLAPGDRVDYLVKAPTVTTRQCYENKQVSVGAVPDTVRRRRPLRASAPTELLTVCVEPSSASPMQFPPQLPPLPGFLANIPPQASTTPVAFSMTGPDGKPTVPLDPRNNFYIDNVQYCPNCANQTMTLGTAYEWLITNDSTPQHPFHIHTNPHQLAEQGFMDNNTPVAVQKYASPIWEDTIALASLGQCWSVPAGPIWDQNDALDKCPKVCAGISTKLQWKGNWVTTVANQASVCSCCAPDTSAGYTRIRQQPTDFTGEFVLHCHILGHEDRGMMQNVQVVCPAPNEKSFGKPKAGQAECVEGNYTPAAPQCPDRYKTGEQCPAS